VDEGWKPRKWMEGKKNDEGRTKQEADRKENVELEKREKRKHWSQGG